MVGVDIQGPVKDHESVPKTNDFIPPRQRLVSECSSEGGFENLRPLELEDLTSFQNKDKNRYLYTFMTEVSHIRVYITHTTFQTL
jgi:hypothetical protein